MIIKPDNRRSDPLDLQCQGRLSESKIRVATLFREADLGLPRNIAFPFFEMMEQPQKCQMAH